MTNVVLTLGGLNYGKTDRLDTALKGYATAQGRQRLIVDYPQAANEGSILTGVARLQQAIRLQILSGNHVTVMGHSQGAEVASEWLERYAKAPDAPQRGQLEFILLGNPCRRLGGVVTSGSWLTKHGFLGRRKPTPESQYKTIDVTRAGDVWSNTDGWPTGKKPKVSWWQKLLGLDPHTKYDDVDLQTAQLRERVGNTTYLVAP